MKYHTLLIFILFIVFAAACENQRTLDFQGEGEHWEVDYTVDIYDETGQEISYVIKYLGDNDISEDLDYEIGFSSVTGARLNEENMIEHWGTGCETCSVIREDEEIEFSIEWEGKSENFTLE